MTSKTTITKENKKERLAEIINLSLFFLSHPKHYVLKAIPGWQLRKVLQMITVWKDQANMAIEVYNKRDTSPNGLDHGTETGKGITK